MKSPKWIQAEPLTKLTPIFIYFAVFLYILIFRFYNNIVGSGESEFFPIEIITTACILAALIFIYMIYKGDLLRIGKGNILYPCLITTFFLYYLAENNWLYGRDHIVGIIIFGAIMGAVFIITLSKVLRINMKAGVIFGIAIFFLVFGTLVDASIDGYIPIDFGFYRAGLVEEAFELYASMFFLHSLLLLYFSSNSKELLFELNKRKLINIFTGAMLLSFGNSLLLQDRGGPVPISRNLLGAAIIGFSLSMFYILLVIKTPQEKSKEIKEMEISLLE